MAKKGETLSEETKAKMRASQQARVSRNREQLLQACNYIHIGAKRNATTRAKMSWARQGRKHSPATIEKIRLAALARAQRAS